jgi:soluble lytic murein transglycosylase-like protein
MSKLTLALVLALATLTPTIVEQCRYYDAKTMAAVSYISSAFNKAPHDIAKIYGAATQVAIKYDVPVTQVLAMIAAESSFNPLAASKAGAQGLLQITPQSGKTVSKDVDANLDAGVQLFSEYRRRYGQKATQMFNVGPTGFYRGRRAAQYEARVKYFKREIEKL